MKTNNKFIHLSVLFALLLSLAGGALNVSPSQAAASNTSEWTWVDGPKTVDQPGVYGTEDIPGVANVPGARSRSVSWVDSSGDLWLFGGYAMDSTGSRDLLNDLWRFDPGSEQWTWVDGSNTVDQSGVYGNEDVPNAANIPGARSDSISWIDSSGDLWLFGGFGYGIPGNWGWLNDLWRFDPDIEQWTWVDGSNLRDQSGVYGSEDVSGAANVPGARESSASWIDGSGNLWLFGGYGRDGTGSWGYLQDLWKFDPVSGQWTWVDGSISGNQSGVYGTEDIPSAASVPGGRNGLTSWIDSNGSLFLFGGYGYDIAGSVGNLNDLWKFDTGTGQWTWVDGSNSHDQSGVYGIEDTPGTANVPGGRESSLSWIDSSGDLWLFGGNGVNGTGSIGYLNDLWRFNPGTGQWTWVDGSTSHNQGGTYGIEDTPDVANVPGGRSAFVSWIDNSGSLWLFGGTGMDSLGTWGVMNDLWRFSDKNIRVTIGSDLEGEYYLTNGQGTVREYGGANGGPVVVESTDGQNIIASLIQYRRPGFSGAWTGITQTMALTDAQISDKYAFPYYDYSDPTKYNSLQLANFGSNDTIISIEIGGVLQGTYAISAGSSQNVTFPGVTGGPVVVSSDNRARIIASLYELKRSGSTGLYTGQTTMMGLPWAQLTDTYIIPRYNHIPQDILPYIVFANADSVSTNVTVTIGGNLMGTYAMEPGKSTLLEYTTADGGPVVVESDNGADIIASLLQYRRPGFSGSWTGITQTMALTEAQISDKYVFPYYDFSDPAKYNSLQLANFDSIDTDISVEIGGVLQGTYAIPAKGSQNVTFPDVTGGPVVVSSSNGAQVIVSLYELKRPGATGLYTGQTTMMGLPWSQLSETYIIPRYNHIPQDILPYVVFGVP